jgi:hypothetical protein
MRSRQAEQSAQKLSMQAINGGVIFAIKGKDEAVRMLNLNGSDPGPIGEARDG